MATVLIATDADAVADDVESALLDEGTTVLRVRAGADVPAAVARHEPELCVLDLQMGNMGAMAVCMELRHEAGAGRLPATKVLMLLDRGADAFLARRSAADGWLVKPLDAFRLRRAARTVLQGGTYTESSDAITIPAVAEG